ncbi:MAG: hypothetical protein LBI40_03020 [Treponema sp.]|nr:hypothetical protein [Treponema sp.]
MQDITANISESKLETDKIDAFFSILTDIYVTILENGVVSIESDEADGIQFASRHTQDFLLSG